MAIGESDGNMRVRLEYGSKMALYGNKVTIYEYDWNMGLVWPYGSKLTL